MNKKKGLAYMISGGLLAGSYLAAGGIGYLMGDGDTYAPTIKEKPRIVDSKRQQGLEKILGVSQKLLNACTYEFEINMLGKKVKSTKTLYFIGSAVGIHKNLEESTVMFLSCDHVTRKPEKIYVMKTKLRNGLYKGLARLEDGSTREFVAVDSLFNPAAHPIGHGILKGSKLGLFKSIEYDPRGRVKKMNVDELTELADTDAGSKMSIKDDDITLLRLKEGAGVDLSKYKVWSGPWGDEALLKPGQEVYAVGHPLNLAKLITQGIISSKGTDRPDLSENFYFSSAQLNPGNSGGGVWVVQNVETKEGIEERLAFIGLGRLKFYGDGISGIVKLSKIKSFLRKEGYSYLYKK